MDIKTLEQAHQDLFLRHNKDIKYTTHLVRGTYKSPPNLHELLWGKCKARGVFTETSPQDGLTLQDFMD